MSLDDGTLESRICKLVYNPTVSELLRLRNWRWAMGLASLARNATNPNFDWAYSYALPTDFGRVVAFNNFDNLAAVIAYEIQGKSILTDETTAQLAYIKNTGDPNLFDAVFTECLVLRIASKLAKPLGGSMEITKQLNEEFQQYLQGAEVISEKDFTQRRLIAPVSGFSSVSISNMALARLGKATISSLSENSAEARLCTLFYQPTVSELLRLRDWQWAKGQATLSSTTNPSFNWSYAYTLPADYGRMVDFNKFDDYSSKPPFEIQGGLLLTNENTANITYIKETVSEALFDGVFADLLSVRLASKLVMPLGADPKLIELFSAEYASYLQAADKIDDSERSERNSNLAASPNTPTSISNMALSRIGKSTINSITDSSAISQLCNLHYSITVSELLRLRDWAWAKSYVSLTSAANPTVSKWNRAYNLPSDFGRMIALNKLDDFTSEYPYEIVGNQLLTNETSASIQYVKNTVSESSFDGVFIDLLVCRLAMKLVMPTGADANLLKVLDAEFSNYLQIAEKLAENESKDLRAATVAATPTSTSICNMALSKVSNKLIDSLTDNTPEARLCNLFYTPAVNEILRLHDWNWATALATLSPLTLTASVAVSTTTATATVTAHGLSVGQTITVTGSSNANVNGAWTIATVPTANTFTFTLKTSATGTYTGVSVAPTPPFDWSYCYALPSDFNRIVTLNAFDSGQANVNYEIIGALLYTDESYANISYIKQNVSPALFDSLFIDLLATKIAERIAPAMGVNPNVVQGLSVQFSRSLAAARRIDASEGDPRVKPYLVNSNLVNARYTGIY